jgi:hypothetical protein
MKTKNQIIAELKTKNSTLRTGSEESGYVDLGETEYEATIAEWADNLLASQTAETKAKAAKTAAEAKLAALGLTPEDLKALGL